jgi:hypothetical protein
MRRSITTPTKASTARLVKIILFFVITRKMENALLSSTKPKEFSKHYKLSFLNEKKVFLTVFYMSIVLSPHPKDFLSPKRAKASLGERGLIFLALLSIKVLRLLKVALATQQTERVSLGLRFEI